MKVPAAAVSALLLCLAACGGGGGDGGPSPSPSPQAQLLSSTGLYTNIATQQIDPQNRFFAPQYVLWSDGGTKGRWLRLPTGTRIDSSDMNRWVFPVGTKIWKEFVFQGRRVETRLMEKIAPGEGTAAWSFRTFQWRADGSDAELASADGVRDVAPTAFGTQHDLPSQAQCTQCHNRGGDAVLGFSALQLSDALDPLAQRPAESVTVDDLVDQGLLTHAPATDPRIAADTPSGRYAMGYLHANCGNCHNPGGTAGFLTMDLFHREGTRSERDEQAYRTTVNRLTTAYVIPGLGASESFRIKPGSTSQSAILVRMNHRSDAHAMPPIGSEVPDEAGIRAVTDWVRRVR
ncbi:MAG TPA: hypothetical protein VFM88_01820 [Vicinamibacteria bacterium]|nr:hypothetical protein [Vicinamibacteria bacterium]